MYIDKDLYYGVEAMLLIAGAPGGRGVNATELALDLGMSRAAATTLLSRLVRADLLRPAGSDSVALNRPADKMPLDEIADAVDRDRRARRTLATPADATRQPMTGGSMIWSAVEAAVLLCLKEVTLGDLLSDELRFDASAWAAFRRAGGVPVWRQTGDGRRARD